MDGFSSKTRFQGRVLTASVLILVQVLSTANGQSISTPCTSAMINSFTPCMNYITGSSYNGTSPISDCCSSLKELMGASMDCACLLVTASIPLPNRSLALSLPKACKSSGVPVQCQASGSPLPAPGPALLGPSPSSSSAFSPQASKAAANGPVAAPEAEALPPAEADVEVPPTAAGIRPVLTPSSGSMRSYTVSSPATFMLIFVGFMALSMY